MPFRPSSKWLARHLARDRASLDTRPIKLIVGLGNPGTRYTRNRHNVGFMLLDRFAAGQGLSFARRRFDAFLADGGVGDHRVVLAKPQTFMNASGAAVGKLVSFYHIPLHDIIICYDDLDLPFGRLRIRSQGSAGGHHGMESIIATLRTDDFARVRVGIGRPDSKEDIGHVLGNFSTEEEKGLGQVLDRAVGALDTWLGQGVVQAMNTFNS